MGNCERLCAISRGLDSQPRRIRRRPRPCAEETFSRVPTWPARKKEHAARISDAAGRKPDQRRQWNRERKWMIRDWNQPAHSKVKRHRQLRMTGWTTRRLHDDAENRERPNDSENSRATDAAKRTQRERRICPCDEQKNRGMIQHTQNGFRARLRPCVVKR